MEEVGQYVGLLIETVDAVTSSIVAGLTNPDVVDSVY